MKLSPWLLCSCLAYFYSFIKRTIFRFRRRRSSDPSLPTKGSGPGGGGPSSSANGSSAKNYANTSGVDLAWDDWGDGSTMSIKIDPTTPTVAPSNQTAPSSLSNPENEEEEDHVDYFADMTPRYKKPPTIRKKTPQMIPGPSSLTQGLSNRLTLGMDETAVLTDELGAWSENDNGWGEEAGDDLAWEADQVIREKKLAERERRAAEQRRKKMERDAQRVTKKDTGKLATKLK
ncbi:receptor-binding cancer antigen expressed on SiSo cells isoform X2 [Strongylocentrotus purpuratus]|uniref:Receptor-binding cancer antigen expressed on SiSo cells n=1 Tax=Strongylocentrotus purpuratus TaxID=7668 RepID=A0A7M7GH02_STRPU|nr:receptor-binding cancer antigen expressed on SiSo cells isoform X1 [Strongylocentrotus purpuratus]XP_030833683.1 receptor-binding cancer antigen expressed on SiSo cells [Strongylocentrotus purpuratus]XP_030833695.1 receptor-binding cancer antigen expressed on SiSo cells isoform X2 [Strongylocentrotus purpuratus]|eukprot:XP_003726664.1 PREDICTED: receptor-binding cancer antigen expressed on SiSo cells [Strongylocentrotus purpuratus]